MERLRNTLRRIGLIGGLLVGTLVLLELGAFALLSLHPDWPSRAEIQRTLGASTPADTGGIDAPETNFPRIRAFELHPYLGFVRDPSAPSHALNGIVIDEPVNEHGFFGRSPLAKPAAGEVVIAIAGGSVGAELYLHHREQLRAALQQRRYGERRAIHFVSLALAGMKQPQQLLALTYFLSLGAHFDAVVNVDGFNEVVLPVADNLPTGVPPHFPRSWRLYSAKALDDQTVTLAGLIRVNQVTTERWRARFANTALRHSSLALAVWRLISQDATAERDGLEQQLRQNLDALSADDTTTRSMRQALDLSGMQDMVSLWSQASREMSELCRAEAIRYLHVLQPNQYFPGERNFTRWERHHVIAPPDYKYRAAAERGYPLLVAAAAELRREGLPVLDATDIFASERESVYRDHCCHLNDRGNALLVDAIAEALAAGVSTQVDAREDTAGDERE